MSIHEETEADTRAERIDPVLDAAGWGKVPGSRIRRELICPGRIQSGGKRGTDLSCDYVLFYNGQKLATIEAKRAGKSHTDGVAQTKRYATRLGARFAYATNGLRWHQIDLKTADEGEMDLPFPTPNQLWDRMFPRPLDWRERFGAVEFETAGGKWEPRYYQHNAIVATLEAVAKGDRRILLTLATGTGKTSIAFQIAWKLFQAKWNISGKPNRRPRILFLADRNILADQAYNAFSAFPPDAITRIDPKTIAKNHGEPPRNASLFFTIFQTFMTGEDQLTYQQYPADFFDFIIVDECHRGGAKDESEWRAILEYFEPATQLGLTATPKRKNNADTYAYFGEPAYVYALKEGINDGFLTPFKVRQMASTIDEYVFNGADKVIQGEVEIGDVFDEADFNTRVIIEERELSRVREFMSQIDQRQKTLVFCATQEHAALIRELINQVKEIKHPDYCHRVTADDGDIGEQHLRDFQDNEKSIPTILTTSQKLSTGVDARNIRHIVLMRPVKSMIEFKQIIGRGTRTFEGKDFFTVWDFVEGYRNFQDPEWDGEPLEPGLPPKPRVLPKDAEKPNSDIAVEGLDGTESTNEKIEIRLSDGSVRRIQYIGSTNYYGPDGKMMSAKDFLNRLFGDLSGLVIDEDELRSIWSNPDSRERLMTRLLELGYDDEKFTDIKKLVDAQNSDLFDVLSYIRFTLFPKTRQERANGVRLAGLPSDEDELKSLLSSILDAYEETGESELSSKKLGVFITSRFGSVSEGKDKLGGLPAAKQAFIDLQTGLYAE